MTVVTMRVLGQYATILAEVREYWSMLSIKIFLLHLITFTDENVMPSINNGEGNRADEKKGKRKSDIFKCSSKIQNF